MLMLAATLATATLSPGKPSRKSIEQIEQRLASNRCVKPLSRWWRHYAYSHEGSTDTRFIDIWFIGAGHDKLPAGRFITEPEPPMLDDSQFRLVTAKYKVATGQFVHYYCGLNHPDKPADWNGR